MREGFREEGLLEAGAACPNAEPAARDHPAAIQPEAGVASDRRRKLFHPELYPYLPVQILLHILTHLIFLTLLTVLIYLIYPIYLVHPIYLTRISFTNTVSRGKGFVKIYRKEVRGFPEFG